jgi:hypothetical protein
MAHPTLLTLRAGRSTTATVTVAVVDMAGAVPVTPPPAQDTVHDTVAVTGYEPGLVNVCPHVGDGDNASRPGVHAVPGPLHVTLAPSPADNTKLTGFAVAVTLIPGTDAVADRGPHESPPSHTQVGKYTICGAGAAGFTRITGAGSRSALTASSARSCGPGGVPKIRKRVRPGTGGYPHAPTYQAPDGFGTPPRACAPARSSPVAGR